VSSYYYIDAKPRWCDKHRRIIPTSTRSNPIITSTRSQLPHISLSWEWKTKKRSSQISTEHATRVGSGRRWSTSWHGTKEEAHERAWCMMGIL
jgi:hypothetical protein